MPEIDVINMKFIFQDESILEIKDKSFRSAIALVFEKHMVFNNEPVKIIFPQTKKVLFFDKEAFYAYLKNDLSQMELIEKTQCEALYRNKKQLLTNTHDEIDPGHLWMKIGVHLFLIDKEQEVKCFFKEDLFEEV
jgi:hypothetical protein